MKILATQIHLHRNPSGAWKGILRYNGVEVYATKRVPDVQQAKALLDNLRLVVGRVGETIDG